MQPSDVTALHLHVSDEDGQVLMGDLQELRQRVPAFVLEGLRILRKLCPLQELGHRGGRRCHRVTSDRTDTTAHLAV